MPSLSMTLRLIILPKSALHVRYLRLHSFAPRWTPGASEIGAVCSPHRDVREALGQQRPDLVWPEP